jgi:hypothetical protein
VIVVIVSPTGWQRVFITALLVAPLLLIVVLSTPMWLVLPFLSTPRRNAILQFVDRLIEWIKTVAAG